MVVVDQRKRKEEDVGCIFYLVLVFIWFFLFFFLNWLMRISMQDNAPKFDQKEVYFFFFVCAEVSGDEKLFLKIWTAF